MIIGHHLIWTAYGWWLPNDPRGSSSHEIRVERIADLGELHHGRKPVQPRSAEIRRFYDEARAVLKHELLTFTDEQIALLGAVFEEVIRSRPYTCYGCAIMPDHVHLLIRRHRDRAEEMIPHFQHASREALIAAGHRPEGHPVWGGPGWKVFQNTPEDMKRIADYIRHNPIKAKRPEQTWPFVQPYEGWLPAYHKEGQQGPPEGRRTAKETTPTPTTARTTAMSTVCNFNAGPAMLPPPVLEQVQAELRDYQGRGMSIMEMSHRGKEFEAINAQAEATFKRLLGLGDGYRVLFLQGGASTQFAMVPMNFLPPGGAADFLMTGAWAEKAFEEAGLFGQPRIAASTREGGYRRVPRPDEVRLGPDSAYVHITTNETIHGTQWHAIPDVGDRPLVADMSSDILSRPVDASRFSLLYAGAQKNLGPSGVTAVVLRESWLATANAKVPTMLRYATHARNNSLYNTPPAFGVYVLHLVLGWIERQGGTEAMAKRNQDKARRIYDTIDASGGFYRGHAEPGSRSLMNVTFRLPDEATEKRFLAEAQAADMVGLAGHRSVGGVRASIYNAVSPEACQRLAELMGDFARRNA